MTEWDSRTGTEPRPQSKVKAEKENKMQLINNVNTNGMKLYQICFIKDKLFQTQESAEKYLQETIQNLKEENLSLWNDNKRYQKMITEFQNKVSRRNMQIKDKEKKILDLTAKLLKISGQVSCFYNGFKDGKEYMEKISNIIYDREV